jgi:hypothetical protein
MRMKCLPALLIAVALPVQAGDRQGLKDQLSQIAQGVPAIEAALASGNTEAIIEAADPVSELTDTFSDTLAHFAATNGTTKGSRKAQRKCLPLRAYLLTFTQAPIMAGLEQKDWLDLAHALRSSIKMCRKAIAALAT